MLSEHEDYKWQVPQLCSKETRVHRNMGPGAASFIVKEGGSNDKSKSV